MLKKTNKGKDSHQIQKKTETVEGRKKFGQSGIGIISIHVSAMRRRAEFPAKNQISHFPSVWAGTYSTIYSGRKIMAANRNQYSSDFLEYSFLSVSKNKIPALIRLLQRVLPGRSLQLSNFT